MLLNMTGTSSSNQCLVFDLILGTDTMEELGIILNFKQQEITIDEISLPMCDITNLPLNRGLTCMA